MSRQSHLGAVRQAPTGSLWRRLGRWGLLLGWILISVGYYGAWMAHPTSALTLSGADMAEFVKFLPAVLDGTLPVVRQLFYLPPLAVCVTIAFLIGSRRLALPGHVQGAGLILAVPVSLQLLPPAWSFASLRSPEFLPQTLALIGCWTLLALFWLLGRLPLLWSGLIATAVSLLSLALCAWQMALVKPAIDAVYGTAPGIGWGFWLCVVGLALLSLAGLALAAPKRGPKVRRL